MVESISRLVEVNPVILPEHSHAISLWPPGIYSNIYFWRPVSLKSFTIIFCFCVNVGNFWVPIMMMLLRPNYWSRPFSNTPINEWKETKYDTIGKIIRDDVLWREVHHRYCDVRGQLAILCSPGVHITNSWKVREPWMRGGRLSPPFKVFGWISMSWSFSFSGILSWRGLYNSRGRNRRHILHNQQRIGTFSHIFNCDTKIA